MLKVNEEKLLLDHKVLVDKKEKNLAAIEKQATLYAIERGYDEGMTAKFVAFTKDLEGNGLTAAETAKLELLSYYIEEVEEPAQEEVAEATPVDDLDAAATVNIV